MNTLQLLLNTPAPASVAEAEGFLFSLVAGLAVYFILRHFGNGKGISGTINDLNS